MLILILSVGAVALLGVLLAPVINRAYRDLTQLPLADTAIIRQQASEKHLDPALIAAVIYAETKFSPRTSPTGAEGLMQIEPATAEYLARLSGASTFSVSDLQDPQVNIAYGSFYLRYLLNQFGGNRMLAIAAYNGGESNVDRWRAEARSQGHALSVGDIPFDQTRLYVTRVLNAERAYRRTYGSELGP